MTPDELDQIVANDAAWGPEMQFAPAAWQDRRALLQLIREEREAVAAAVKELDALVFGEAQEGSTLEGIVDELRARVEMRQATTAANSITHIGGMSAEDVKLLADLQHELHSPFRGVTQDFSTCRPLWHCSTGSLHPVGCACDCPSVPS